MIGLYTPLLILQAFCVYHAYKNNVEQRWYWFIIFFPGVGSALYLYHNFYSRNNIEKLTEGVKEVVNTNYKLEQLEKALRFSENISNKTNLADAYVSYGKYADGIRLYEECLSGYMADDAVIRMKVLNAFYRLQDFDSVIKYGTLLELDKEFQNAEQRVDYAWSLFHRGDVERAQGLFKSMNRTFTNYRHRVEYCKFLKIVNNENNQHEFSDTLAELAQELEYMKGPERRLYKDIIREIRELQVKYSG